MFVNWLIISKYYFWDRTLIAFFINSPQEGLALKSLFHMKRQGEADMFAEKLEWLARELRKGNFNK